LTAGDARADRTISAGRGPLALRVLWQLWWVSVPLWPLGFAAWAPFAWRLLASRHWRDAYALAGYLAAAAAQVTLLVVASAPLYRPLETRDSAVLRAARHRVRRRRAARKLAGRAPARAARLGIGRPDLQRSYDDGGLVDINHAPDGTLAGQLGMTQHEIDAVHAARQRPDTFSSGNELSVYAGLPAHRVDELRDFIICL
jgi:hypothetical protein